MTLAKDGADFVSTRSFASEDLLNAALPNGVYQLDLNGGSSTATINFVRLSVPSPAISAPDRLLLQPPGAIEVKFAGCPACNAASDSIAARLEQGASLLASANLTGADGSWIPSDAGGPLELPENSAFTVRITHSAERVADLDGNGSQETSALLAGVKLRKEIRSVLPSSVAPLTEESSPSRLQLPERNADQQVGGRERP